MNNPCDKEERKKIKSLQTCRKDNFKSTMISVIIPLYNKEDRIVNALNSVKAQTYRDYEVIVVNDGSSDNSEAKVLAVNSQEMPIRLINQSNMGVSAARNRGIKEARGEFVAFLDADDEWHKDYLATQIASVVNYPECNVFATGYQFIDEFGEIRKPLFRNLEFNSNKEEGVLQNYYHVAATSDSPLWTSAVMVRKASILEVGGFPLGVTSGEDLLTWARLAAVNIIAFIPSAKVNYFTPSYGPSGNPPSDLSSTKDFVGESLLQLSERYPNKGIEEYLSFWYKMRGVINLNLNQRIGAIKCSLKSISYNKRNIKSWLLLLLSISPRGIISWAFRK